MLKLYPIPQALEERVNLGEFSAERASFDPTAK
jgi:hypothetical protein